MRRVWIEMPPFWVERSLGRASPSMRRVWIEILVVIPAARRTPVTLHAEGVD